MTRNLHFMLSGKKESHSYYQNPKIMRHKQWEPKFLGEAVFFCYTAGKNSPAFSMQIVALPKHAPSPRPNPSPSFCARRLPAAKPPVAYAERFSAAVLPPVLAGTGALRHYYRRQSGAEQRLCHFLEPKGPARQSGISGKRGRRNIKRKWRRRGS